MKQKTIYIIYTIIQSDNAKMGNNKDKDIIFFLFNVDFLIDITHVFTITMSIYHELYVKSAFY